jgi:hypothetical protein
MADDVTEYRRILQLARQAPPGGPAGDEPELPWVVTMASGDKQIVHLTTSEAVYLEDNGYEGRIIIAREQDLTTLIPPYGNPGGGGSEYSTEIQQQTVEEINRGRAEREAVAESYPRAPAGTQPLSTSQAYNIPEGGWIGAAGESGQWLSNTGTVNGNDIEAGRGYPFHQRWRTGTVSEWLHLRRASTPQDTGDGSTIWDWRMSDVQTGQVTDSESYVTYGEYNYEQFARYISNVLGLGHTE